MTNNDYQRVIEIRNTIAAKKGITRAFEEIPGLGTSEQPTKWLYYFTEKYLFIEGGLHESGTHMRKTEQEANMLLSINRSDMMVTVVKIGDEEMIFPKILEGLDDLHRIEVRSLKALSDQIFADTAVRIPVTELE